MSSSDVRVSLKNHLVLPHWKHPNKPTPENKRLEPPKIGGFGISCFYCFSSSVLEIFREKPWPFCILGAPQLHVSELSYPNGKSSWVSIIDPNTLKFSPLPWRLPWSTAWLLWFVAWPLWWQPLNQTPRRKRNGRRWGPWKKRGCKWEKTPNISW